MDLGPREELNPAPRRLFRIALLQHASECEPAPRTRSPQSNPQHSFTDIGSSKSHTTRTRPIHAHPTRLIHRTCEIDAVREEGILTSLSTPTMQMMAKSSEPEACLSMCRSNHDEWVWWRWWIESIL